MIEDMDNRFIKEYREKYGYIPSGARNSASAQNFEAENAASTSQKGTSHRIEDRAGRPSVKATDERTNASRVEDCNRERERERSPSLHGGSRIGWLTAAQMLACTALLALLVNVLANPASIIRSTSVIVEHLSNGFSEAGRILDHLHYSLIYKEEKAKDQVRKQLAQENHEENSTDRMELNPDSPKPAPHKTAVARSRKRKAPICSDRKSPVSTAPLPALTQASRLEDQEPQAGVPACVVPSRVLDAKNRKPESSSRKYTEPE